MAAPQDTRESFLDTLMGQAAAIAAMVAGTVGLLYAIGGAVMWLRFDNAGLPADQAVALVPRTDLLVVGLRVMVLPVVASGAGALVAAHALSRRRERRLQKLEHKHAEAIRQLEQLEDAPAEKTPEREAVSRCVDDLANELEHDKEQPATLRAHLPAPRRSPGTFAALVVAAVALVLVVPFSLGALAWPLMIGAMLAYWLRLSSRDGRFIAWKLAVAAMLAGCVISIARQTATPIQLPSVRAEIAHPSDLLLASFDPLATERPKTLVVEGYLVADSNHELDIGVVGTGTQATIATIPKADVTFMMITPPLDLRAPPRSLLSVATGGRWAWTPTGFWCRNLRYGWTRIDTACAAQPAIAVPDRLEIARDEISNLAITCPTAANGSCSGFAKITTLEPALQGTRLAAVETAAQKFSTTAGTEFPLMFPLDNDVLWKQFAAGRAAKRCGTSHDFCVPVRIRVSRDEAGRAVLEQRTAVLRLSAPVSKPRRHGDRPATPPVGGGGGSDPPDGGDGPRAHPTPTPEATETPEAPVAPDASDPVPPANDPILAPTPDPPADAP